MRVTWLGHSTVVVEVDGARVLADPLLGQHNGILRRRSAHPTGDVWANPDVVLISHLHHDHAELSSLRLLGDVPVLTAPLNAAWLRRKGISGGHGLGKEWFDVPGKPTRVRLAKAVHHSRPMPHRPNEANGHLIWSPGGTAWVAGDTSLYAEMGALPIFAGGPIDLAIVPIWGWGARLSEGHMGPEEAAIACERVAARYALPVHWGTLHVPLLSQFPRGWMDKPGEEFVAALVEHAPNCRPLTLSPGGSAEIPGH